MWGMHLLHSLQTVSLEIMNDILQVKSQRALVRLLGMQQALSQNRVKKLARAKPSRQYQALQR